MALSHPSPLRDRGRGRGRSTLGIIVLTATLSLLAGCVPQGSVIPAPNRTPITYPPADPNAEPRPMSTLGQEWTTFSYPPELAKDVSYDGFSAGGSLWVYDRRDDTVLYGTKDGRTWRTVDAKKYGVPTEDKAGIGWWLTPGVGDPESSTFTLFYDRSSDDGNTWILEVGPESVSASDSSKNGLDVMPLGEDGEKYRNIYALGMQEIQSERVIIGRGYQSLGDGVRIESLSTAFEGPSGTWSVQAPTNWPGGEEVLFPFSMTKVGDRIVVLASEYEAKTPPVAWSTADGLNWQKTELTGVAPELLRAMRNTVSSSEHGIALWANIGERPDNQAYIWTSRDGLNWHHMLLVNEGWELSYVLVEEDGFTAFANGFDKFTRDRITQILYSPDGVSWTSAPGAVVDDVSMMSAIPHEGGLVFLGYDEIKVTGLPWGNP